MSAKEFRAELLKIMPGYEWTVHKPSASKFLKEAGISFLTATGTQSSGFNRLSTLSITKDVRDGKTTYEVKSSGFGLHAKWLHACKSGTLARALRKLQDHYEAVAQTYRIHAADLAKGRIDAAILASKPAGGGTEL